MTMALLAALRPLVGAVDTGGGWLYEFLTKLGVHPDTARTVVDLIVRPVSILVVMVVALIIARVGGKAIRRILDRIADKAASRSGAGRAGARVSTMSGVLANLWRFFVFIVTVAIVLGMLGINLTPLLASATIIGATLGFGAQLIVRDYISGFLLAVEDQFNVGETITVDEVTGVVEDVTMRVTRLRGADGSVYFVPNGDIRLLANTSRGWARAVVDLVLPGSSATELDQVRTIVGEAAHRVAQRPEFAPHCSEPPTLVGFIDADAATFSLRVTLHTVPSERDALTRALREEAIAALAKAGRWPGIAIS
jgi:small-conductance mechanosensitive channel